MTVRGLNIGVSGLRAEGEALGVVGDNIANLSTTGFKRQRSQFEDLVNRSGSGEGSGAGVRNAGTQQIFTQGALSQTGVATDLALNGSGFFMVTGSVNGVTGAFYSRAGQFRADSQGNLVDASGMKLMGRTAKPDGTLSASVAPINIPVGEIPAHRTEAIEVAANLDSSDAVPALPWDLANASDTANYSTSIQIFDSLGAAHELTLYFNKTTDNQWDYHAVANGAELSSLVPEPVEVGSGSLYFTTDGALDQVSESSPITIDFLGATPSQTISLNFGSQVVNGGSGLDGTTQFSMPSGVSSSSQDGYASGALSGIAVLGDGTVEGQYTNGERLTVAQLVIASFRSEDGLARAGNNLWVETQASGAATLGQAGSGGRGGISAGALENSNVDLAQEMVDMIQHQRAYSANSKVIQTADEMLSSLMQLKS